MSDTVTRSLFDENAHLRQRVAELEARLNAMSIDATATSDQAILQAIPDIVFLLDEEGRYLDILTQHDELLFKSVSGLLGHTLQEVLPPDVSGPTKATLLKAIETNSPQIVDYKLTLPDGEHWFEGRCAPLPGDLHSGELRKAVWVAHDITAHYEMAARLREQNALLEQKAQHAVQEVDRHHSNFISLIEQSQFFATYRIESDLSLPCLGKIVFASPSIKENLHISNPEDLQTWFDHVHTDDRERIHRKSREAAESETSFLDEFRLVTPDGLRWVKVISVPVRAGEKLFYNGLIMDVTHQHRVEDDLQHALTRRDELETLVSRSPFITVICKVEPGFPVEYVSENARQYGYPPEYFIGKSCLVSVVPEDRAMVEEKMTRAVEEKATELHMEYRVMGPNNEYIWLEDFGCGRFNADGEMTHFESIVIDITERKAAEIALRESEERYRSLFEYATDAIFWIEPVNFRIVNSNAAAERLIGRPHPVLMGTDFRNLFSPESRNECETIMTEGIAQAGFVSRQVEIVSSTRQIRKVLLSASVTVASSEPVVQLICHDLTEFVETQQALIRSERMAAVGVLAAGVAHEFNNMHTGLLGFLELTLETADLQPSERELLERALQIGRRAAGITRNMLAFSRKSTAVRQMEDIGSVVDDVLVLIQSELRCEGIRLDKSIEAIDSFLMDRSQIGQVVLNLLINARHALREQKEKIISVSVRQEGGKCLLQVSDTGIGIAPERMKDLFLPFFTTKGEHAERGSSQSSVRGTGLGLSVSDRIVRDHGGEIRVESKLGIGTTFTVILPMERETVGAGNYLSSKGEDGGEKHHHILGSRILVLDDEADVRELLATSLKRRGYIVTALPDGEAALQMHANTPFDLMLIDLQMPKMTGIEFLQLLRKQCGGGEACPPVVVITGRIGDADDASVQQEPVRDVVMKPFSVHGLCDQVYQILAAV